MITKSRFRPLSIWPDGFSQKVPNTLQRWKKCGVGWNSRWLLVRPYAVAGPPAGKADRAMGARHYAELLELGKSFGVKPAFEYLGFVDDINTIDDAIEIIERSGHPDATVVVDPFRLLARAAGRSVR